MNLRRGTHKKRLRTGAPVVWGLVLTAVSSTVRAQDPASTNTLLTVAVWDFPPFVSVSPSGMPSGFAIDVLEAVARRAGLEVRYLSTSSSTAARDALNDGSANVIPSLGILSSRGDTVDFSAPVQTMDVGLFVRVSTAGVRDVADVANRQVAVVRGNSGEQIITPETGAIPVAYEQSSAALSALLAGQVDAMVYPTPMLWTLATELGVRDLVKQAGRPLREVRRGLAVAKGDAALLARLNPAIEELMASDEYAQLVSRWYAPEPTFWTRRRLLTAVGAILLLIAFGHHIRVWGLNRRLAAAGERLESAVRERELLLREIHHRVKNNLQVVSSLQHLQAAATEIPAVRAAFEASYARVASMALVHERLYQAGSMSAVDLGAYLSDLVCHLGFVYDAEGKGIALTVKVPGALVTPDVAVPCGLIVTELVSNSLRHAFPLSSGGGSISVEVRGSSRRGRWLTVRDSGAGFDREVIARRQTKTLGLSLVDLLAGQLGGTATYSFHAGTEVVVAMSAQAAGTTKARVIRETT